MAPPAGVAGLRLLLAERLGQDLGRRHRSHFALKESKPSGEVTG